MPIHALGGEKVRRKDLSSVHVHDAVADASARCDLTIYPVGVMSDRGHIDDARIRAAKGVR